MGARLDDPGQRPVAVQYGMLQPIGSYFHQGGGGCALWVDPIHHVVGVYLSDGQMDSVTRAPSFEFDKFQNMVTAAIRSDA